MSGPTSGGIRLVSAPSILPDADDRWRAPTLSAVQELSVDRIREPAHRLRSDTGDRAHARSLADLDVELPPITVHRATLEVVDGVQRLRAAALAGRATIAVRYFDGSADEAFLLAVHANSRHGRPLSPEERSAAVRRILVIRPEWSDRAVAQAAGLSAKTVAAVRRVFEAEEGPRTRVGRDGRARPVDAAEGRVRAVELLTAQPQASLRSIARQAGISPSTARDVRDRISRGEDPVPVRRRPTARGPRPAAAPVDPARVMASLARDPALRYTDSGRRLLRLLTAHHLPQDLRDELLRTVPEHSVRGVVAAARACALAWDLLADSLAAQEGARTEEQAA